MVMLFSQKNINFGWMAIPENDLIGMFGEEKVSLARTYIGRDIYLKDFGSIPSTKQSTDLIHAKQTLECIPLKYL